MKKNAVVTGASSGVGRAIALKLAAQDWNVALIARRAEALHDLTAGNRRLTAFPCDIADSAALLKTTQNILETFGTCDVLVNAAGTNTKDRSFQNLSFETWKKVFDTNLTGTYLCIQAFLPGMRKQKSGTVINIVSDSAVQASAKAGAAYASSKFAMRGLTQSLNAEERQNGIRATAILPGDIDTPLLENRPTPPTAEARKTMLTADDVADCAMLAINLPSRAIVEELLIRPR